MAPPAAPTAAPFPASPAMAPPTAPTAAPRAAPFTALGRGPAGAARHADADLLREVRRRRAGLLRALVDVPAPPQLVEREAPVEPADLVRVLGDVPAHEDFPRPRQVGRVHARAHPDGRGAVGRDRVV